MKLGRHNLGRTLVGVAALLASTPALPQAAGGGGGGGGLAAYTIEITPSIGVNLPYDLWGHDGTFNTLGVRGAYNLQPLGATGAVEGGFVYQHSDPDRVYTTDFGYRYDFEQEGINAFFAFGLHWSKFNLEADYEEGHEGDDDYCVPSNCATDSGSHSGLYFGGGLIVPIRPMIPVKFSMRLNNNPQLWLLLELGVGFRF